VPFSGFNLYDKYEGIQGQVYLENISESAVRYEWDFDNGETSNEENPVANFTEDGTYYIQLVAFNEYECPDTTIIEYQLLFKSLYMPNAFMPQGAEELRYWRPVGVNIKKYSVEVYNLWGNLVWSSTRLTSRGSPGDYWIGYSNNDKNEELLSPGNYIWKASAIFVDGTIWNGMEDEDGNFRTSGIITLIR